MRGVALALLMAVSGLAQAHGIDIPSWLPRHAVTITHAIPITTRGPTPQGVREQTITGMLYRPAREGRMPGAVIVNSSGGVSGDSELVWAAYMAELGMAVLVLDSFTPRGIRNTTEDQSQLDQYWSNHDGAAGWRWLSRQDFVARDSILILGMSRGGTAALVNADLRERTRMRVEDTSFAAHVAISPWCGLHMRTPTTTGAPILFLLGELDDYTPTQDCLDYALALRAAGNSNVRQAVYPGGFHAPELGWGTEILPDATTWNGCGRLLREDDFSAFDERTRQRIPANELGSWGDRNCMRRGVSVGGDRRLRRQMGADLLRFLMQYDFVRDVELRSLLPSCATLPERIGLRRSCERAGWGWPVEAALLAWHLRSGSSTLPNDPARAVGLMRLAAHRGEATAQVNLATWLRQGSQGQSRNLVEAREWAQRAEAQGAPGGAVELGLLTEIDGDLRTARRHFQKAAEQYNRFGMGLYGRFLAGGLGGAADPIAAERWLRLSIHYGNQWAHLYLARALESGQLGRPAEPAAALASYRAAAALNFDGQAEARRNVSRLEMALRPAR